MAIQNEPTRIQIPFADSGTKNVIPDTNSTPSASQAASWTDGFPAQCSLPLSAGGIPPARADFNGIFNTMTQSERFAQEGGVWAWDATVDYAASRVVLGSDGKLYWSVAQSGPNVGGAQDPTADDGTYWQLMPMYDADVVHKTGNETIAGEKTFTDFMRLTKDNPYIYFKETDADRELPAYGYQGIWFLDKNDKAVASLIAGIEDNQTPPTFYMAIRAYKQGGDNRILQLWYQSAWTFGPRGGSNDVNLGEAGNKWKQLYATTATINTSDARLKTEPEPVPDDVLDAWGDVGFMQFQMLDAVEEKGADKARLHNGMIAQRIDEAFKARGLDASRYGLFCWDQWDARPESVDKDGNILQPAVAAGDCYSLRYEEALCMEAAYQRRRADRAEARLAALEERLAAIEAQLG